LQIKIKGATLVSPFILQIMLIIMSTTSIKLPDDIKQKANAAALDFGITPHAFMVEAIRKATLAAEKQAAFIAEAQAARTATLQSGLGYAATDVHTHLRKRISEKIDAEKKKKPSTPSKLTAKPWRA
jgi:predicted transcriptional regulator